MLVCALLKVTQQLLFIPFQGERKREGERGWGRGGGKNKEGIDQLHGTLLKIRIKVECELF